MITATSLKCFLGLAVTLANSQSAFQVDFGGVLSGGSDGLATATYQLSGSIGQPLVGSIGGLTYELSTGFWPLITALPEALRDSDRDTLPDSFELAYGLDPKDPRDARTDFDRDGHSNLEEFLAGTDPSKAGSVFKIEQANAGQGTLSFTFSAVPKRVYRIARKDSLLNSRWIAVTDLVGETGALTFSVKIDTLGAAYYRVSVLPEE